MGIYPRLNPIPEFAVVIKPSRLHRFPEDTVPRSCRIGPRPLVVGLVSLSPRRCITVDGDKTAESQADNQS